MAIWVWRFDLKDGPHIVEVECSVWTGASTTWVDGAVAAEMSRRVDHQVTVGQYVGQIRAVTGLVREGFELTAGGEEIGEGVKADSSYQPGHRPRTAPPASMDRPIALRVCEACGVSFPAESEFCVECGKVPAETAPPLAARPQQPQPRRLTECELTQDEMRIRKEPDPDSRSTATLRRGATFFITQTVARRGRKWHRIETSNGVQGFIPDTSQFEALARPDEGVGEKIERETNRGAAYGFMMLTLASLVAVVAYVYELRGVRWGLIALAFVIGVGGIWKGLFGVRRR